MLFCIVILCEPDKQFQEKIFVWLVLDRLGIDYRLRIEISPVFIENRESKFLL